MGDGPLPEANHTAIPCEDGGRCPGGRMFGGPGSRPPRAFAPPPPPPVVHGPAGYAIAGKVLLAAAGAFAGILLALVALHLYSSSRRRRLGGGRRRLLRSLAIAGAGAGEGRDGGAAPSPCGLDPAVLAGIPVVVVGGTDEGAGAGGGDCAVCLAELERGEKARALPRCGHRFHVECIDAWFRGNATCPLCRAEVAVAPGAAAPSAPPAEDHGAQPEVRIDVARDAVDAPAGNGSLTPAMGRRPSGTDLEKAGRVSS
ncbi:hypothetical protein U9M48_020000 [Paspalum notatum var. saurae]|uniref:RING-type E3 ubiquitin transferase n=1 Tax=Paspalum notatum var. saurae TaxID=547442 RepID=A0AAQ3TGP2_PASNO